MADWELPALISLRNTDKPGLSGPHDIYANCRIQLVSCNTSDEQKTDKNCCKEDPFQGPELGSCLTFRNELSEETHVLKKQEILLGKGTRVESSRVREPRRTAVPRGSQCGVLW